MTYREHIQQMIEEVEDIYDRAGALRDHAVSKEKEVFNVTRLLTREVSQQLRRLDNYLSKNRATEDIGGWRGKN